LADFPDPIFVEPFKNWCNFHTMENTQKMPIEISDMFEQVVPDAQLYRKI